VGVGGGGGVGEEEVEERFCLQSTTNKALAGGGARFGFALANARGMVEEEGSGGAV